MVIPQASTVRPCSSAVTNLLIPPFPVAAAWGALCNKAIRAQEPRRLLYFSRILLAHNPLLVRLRKA